MPASCAAINCTNRFSKEAGRSFYRFPLSNDELCKRWIQAMRRNNWVPTKSSFLCSDHFEDKCFRYNNQRRSLQLNAVPTIFKLPSLKNGADTYSNFRLSENKLNCPFNELFGATTKMELGKCKEDSVISNIGQELAECVGICSLCGSSEKIIYADSESKLVCEDCNGKATESVTSIDNSARVDECDPSQVGCSGRLPDEPQNGDDEWCASSEGSCEDGGEYELTVTEEALLRLHGLSLKLPIPCDLCPPGTVFDDLDEFDAHMSDHPEAKMFACQLCSNTYKSWSNLVAHRKVFHQGEVLSCVECGSRRSHARLEGAVHYPVGGKLHGCEECNIGLDTVSDVYRHYWRHMAPPGSWNLEGITPKLGRAAKKSFAIGEERGGGELVILPADAVGGSVSGLNGLAGERASKCGGAAVVQHFPPSGSHKHACPHCLFSSASLEEFRSHISSSAKGHGCAAACCRGPSKKATDHEYCHPQPQHYDCVPCSRVLASEESFEEHLKSAHGGEELPCCTCGRTHRSSALLEHAKACRRRQAEWEARRRTDRKVCQWCGKAFRRAAALRRHVELHEAGRRKQHDCASCGRSFRHGGAYAKHLSANPGHGPVDAGAGELGGGQANFVCEFCGRTFAKKDGLKIHLMRHSGVKPHACPNCPKAFLSRTSLSVHVRQHTGERPYMCEICGKNFTGPTSLYVHQRTHRVRGAREERGAARHVCPVCGKVLSSKLVFEGHVRQHTGERPFACTVCGKGFTTAKIMKMHAKRHAKGKAEWVEAALGGEAATGGADLSGGACIFLCPKCGVGLLSPEELEGHMAGGECPGGGSEMFVLPMASGCTANVVELLANPSSTEVV